MPSAGAIRAGAAYVEVFLEQNPVTRGLSALQSRLRGWSASLGRLGSGAYGGELPGPLAAIANFAASPAGMFAGLLTATKLAASGGTEMADLAEKAGTSVEAISSLAYAARRSHVEIGNLATGIKKMQVSITDAARGGKQGQEALAGVGLTAAELGRLLPEEQFRRIADRIAAIANPTERAAAAVKIFGRNGTELLPLLLQGSDGIARWEGRARALGLVMSGETAEGARKFSQLLGDLQDTMMSGVKVIGGAIIPELTRFVNWIVKGTAAARDWITDHKGIVVTALQVTGAIVAGGLAFSILARVLGMLGSGVGLLLIPFRVLGGLVGTVGSVIAGAFSAVLGTVSAVGGVLGFLLTPMGLLIGAAVALAGYFLWSSGAIGKALDWLKGVFSGLADDATKTFGGIKDALAAGDIALAAKVLWAMLKLEWQTGIAFLEGTWEGFKGFWNDAVIGLAMIFTNATAKIKTLWAEMIGWMEKKWNAFKISGFTETLASWFAPIFAKLQGVSVEDTQKALQEDFSRARTAQPQKDADIDAATKAKTDEIEKERKGTEDELAKDKLRADKDRQGRIDAAQGDVAAARKELDDAVAKAREARDNAAGGPEMPAYAPPGAIPDISNLAGAKASVLGTFSGYALGGLGGAGGIEGRLDDIKTAIEKGVGVNEKIEARLGDGLMLA
jgi:hypothetical protein